MTLGRCLLSGAVVALFFALSTTNARGAAGDYDRRDDLTEAVVACEEAYARLESCCPGFSAYGPSDRRSARCLDWEWRKTSTGCMGGSSVDTGNTEPLALAESACIRDMSCEDLVSHRVCDRAKNDPTEDRDGSRPASRGICP